MKDTLRMALVPESIVDDPRLVRAGKQAAWLHVAALLHLQRHPADEPLITPRILKLIGWGDNDATELAARLTAVGVWVESREGWTIPHGEQVYNEIARRNAIREQRRVAGKKAAKAVAERQLAALAG